MLKEISPDGNVPTSLCPYVRSLVFNICFIVFLISLLITLMYLTGELLEYYGLPFSSNEYLLIFEKIVAGAFVDITLIASLVGLLLLKDKIKEKRSNKPDGVVTAYIKAKHSKICPYIDFTEE